MANAALLACAVITSYKTDHETWRDKRGRDWNGRYWLERVEGINLGLA
jgi:hypothetical protein